MITLATHTLLIRGVHFRWEKRKHTPPAPVQNISLPNKMGATEEDFCGRYGFSEFLSERSSQWWIPKPQFWYPPLRFGSQLRIPKPLFLGFLGIHRWFGFLLGDKLLLTRLSPNYGLSTSSVCKSHPSRFPVFLFSR